MSDSLNLVSFCGLTLIILQVSVKKKNSTLLFHSIQLNVLVFLVRKLFSTFLKKLENRSRTIIYCFRKVFKFVRNLKSFRCKTLVFNPTNASKNSFKHYVMLHRSSFPWYKLLMVLQTSSDRCLVQDSVKVLFNPVTWVLRKQKQRRSTVFKRFI